MHARDLWNFREASKLKQHMVEVFFFLFTLETFQGLSDSPMECSFVPGFEYFLGFFLAQIQLQVRTDSDARLWFQIFSWVKPSFQTFPRGELVSVLKADGIVWRTLPYPLSARTIL